MGCRKPPSLVINRPPAELGVANSTLTVEEMQAQIAELTAQARRGLLAAAAAGRGGRLGEWGRRGLACSTGPLHAHCLGGEIASLCEGMVPGLQTAGWQTCRNPLLLMPCPAAPPRPRSWRRGWRRCAAAARRWCRRPRLRPRRRSVSACWAAGRSTAGSSWRSGARSRRTWRGSRWGGQEGGAGTVGDGRCKRGSSSNSRGREWAVHELDGCWLAGGAVVCG